MGAQERRYTVRQRRLLMQRTQELGATEHEEIFKILQAHKIDHTQNSNGVFVNLNKVSDDIIDKVQRFVDFCFDNKHDLDEYDKRLNECKMSQNYDRFLGRDAAGREAGEDDSDSDAPRGAGSQVAPTQGAPGVLPPTSPPQPVREATVAPGPPPAWMMCTKRMLNSKFHLAKKKFSKRRVPDRKGDGPDQTSNDLAPEPFVLEAWV
jgi:hypothetical protein